MPLNEAMDGEMDVLGTIMHYDEATGSINNNAEPPQKVATLKKILLHKQKCTSTLCKLEEHSCTAYKCPRQLTFLGGFCPNVGAQRCKDGAKHYSMRVYHPTATQIEVDDGHFCQITDKATKKCDCWCLDVYKHESVKDHPNMSWDD